jgi:hypothetical protein
LIWKEFDLKWKVFYLVWKVSDVVSKSVLFGLLNWKWYKPIAIAVTCGRSNAISFRLWGIFLERSKI